MLNAPGSSSSFCIIIQWFKSITDYAEVENYNSLNRMRVLHFEWATCALSCPCNYTISEVKVHWNTLEDTLTPLQLSQVWNLTASHEDISKRFSVEITALQFSPPGHFSWPRRAVLLCMLMVPRAPSHLQFLSVGKLKVEDGFLLCQDFKLRVWLVLSYWNSYKLLCVFRSLITWELILNEQIKTNTFTFLCLKPELRQQTVNYQVLMKWMLRLPAPNQILML